MQRKKHEFCLNVQRFGQPVPKKNPGGDCFACAFTALLKYLYPEKDVNFERVWHFWEIEQDGRRILRNTWPGTHTAFLNALRDESDDFHDLEYKIDYVMPNYDLENYSYAFPPKVNEESYAYRLEGWLRSGWIAMTDINSDPPGFGGVTKEQEGYYDINHYVLIDGIRYGWEKNKVVEGAYDWVADVHIVCSTDKNPEPYWMSFKTLQNYHGTSAWFLMRRRPY